MWRRIGSWFVTTLAPWLLDFLARKSKKPTRQYAYDFRLRMKDRILKGKTKAKGTPGNLDDLPWIGAHTFNGLLTLQLAKKSLTQVYDCLPQSSIIGPDTTGEIRAIITRTIRILDEPSNLNVDADWLDPQLKDYFRKE